MDSSQIIIKLNGVPTSISKLDAESSACLKRLFNHRKKIKLYRELKEFSKIPDEQVNASVEINHLIRIVSKMDWIRSQLDDDDKPKYDQLTKRSRVLIFSAIRAFLDVMHNEKKYQPSMSNLADWQKPSTSYSVNHSKNKPFDLEKSSQNPSTSREINQQNLTSSNLNDPKQFLRKISSMVLSDPKRSLQYVSTINLDDIITLQKHLSKIDLADPKKSLEQLSTITLRDTKKSMQRLSTDNLDETTTLQQNLSTNNTANSKKSLRELYTINLGRLQQRISHINLTDAQQSLQHLSKINLRDPKTSLQQLSTINLGKVPQHMSRINVTDVRQSLQHLSTIDLNDPKKSLSQLSTITLERLQQQFSASNVTDVRKSLQHLPKITVNDVDKSYKHVPKSNLEKQLKKHLSTANLKDIRKFRKQMSKTNLADAKRSINKLSSRNLGDLRQFKQKNSTSNLADMKKIKKKLSSINLDKMRKFKERLSKTNLADLKRKRQQPSTSKEADHKQKKLLLSTGVIAYFKHKPSADKLADDTNHQLSPAYSDNRTRQNKYSESSSSSTDLSHPSLPSDSDDPKTHNQPSRSRLKNDKSIQDDKNYGTSSTRPQQSVQSKTRSSEKDNNSSLPSNWDEPKTHPPKSSLKKVKSIDPLSNNLTNDKNRQPSLTRLNSQKHVQLENDLSHPSLPSNWDDPHKQPSKSSLKKVKSPQPLPSNLDLDYIKNQILPASLTGVKAHQPPPSTLDNTKNNHPSTSTVDDLKSNRHSTSISQEDDEVVIAVTDPVMSEEQIAPHGEQHSVRFGRNEYQQQVRVSITEDRPVHEIDNASIEEASTILTDIDAVARHRPGKVELVVNELEETKPTKIQWRRLEIEEKENILPPSRPGGMFTITNNIGYFLCGTVSGLFTYPFTYPLDLVKTHLQNEQITRAMRNNAKLTWNKCMSISNCLSNTFRSEGMFGLYRGILLTLCSVGIEKSAKFEVYDLFMPRFQEDERQYGIHRNVDFHRYVIAGGLAGLCQTVVTTPMELLKIQIQDSGRVEQSKGNPENPRILKWNAVTIAETEFRKFGVVGLYRGWAATVLRDVLFSALYFPLFENIFEISLESTKETKSLFWCTFLSGFMASAIAAFVVTPFDVVKTRLQLLQRPKTEQSYIGIQDCFKDIFIKEGARTFFKGGICRILVLAPLFGTFQVLYSQRIYKDITGCFKHEELRR